MEKQDIINSLKEFISQIDSIKEENGPKAPAFVKWVRDAKDFIEKAFGASSPHLREFKKIDYYPKKFDIIASPAFKEAWHEGLDQAKAILLELIDITEGKVKKAKEKEEPVIEDNNLNIELNIETGPDKKEENTDYIKEEDSGTLSLPILEEDPQEDIVQEEESKKTKSKKNANKEDKKETVKEKNSIEEEKEMTTGNSASKVLLANISDEALNANVYKFIKIIGYDPIVLDQNLDGDSFVSDTFEEVLGDSDIAFAILFWPGEYKTEGKKTPTPSVFFTTGYLTAKLSAKKVLILHDKDTDISDAKYAGLNFLEIDNIPELMELKVAKKMDESGLYVDFNFFKKK